MHPGYQMVTKLTEMTMMHASPSPAHAIPFQGFLDSTRPYTRVHPAGDSRHSAHLVFRYDDSGELVRVPNMPYNAQRSTSLGFYSCGNPLPDRVDFHRTIAAWREYLLIKPELDALMSRLTSVAEFHEWERRRGEAVKDLRKAYYFDTSDVNSRDSVNHLSLDRICQIAERVVAKANSATTAATQNQ